MTATLVHCRDPFRPAVGRECVQLHGRHRIDTLLRQRGLIVGRGHAMRRTSTYIVLLDGKPLLQEKWAQRVQDEQVLTIVAVPQGGDGSNPLQAVLMVALMVFAPYAAPYVGATIGVSTAVAQGLIMVAGTMLINAIVPPPRPPSVMDQKQASPTYTIGAQGNQARLMNVIPVLYGRHRIYPDFAAQPYVENSGNEQFLYQLFCITQGQCDVEKVLIEDTDISSYAEVQYEVVPPGSPVTLFPDNVATSIEVAGLELKGANESGTWMGPYVANPSGTEVNAIGIDIGFPMGLFTATDSGAFASASGTYEVQAQRINDAGAAIGDWITLDTRTTTLATNTPQQLSYRYQVANGRYQVRARRVGNKDLSSRAANTMMWAGLKGYMPSKHYYGDVTLLAMIIRASNNLNNQSARKVNVIATRKLPVWDGENWSAPQPTRNPAWAMADVLRNSTYGRGLPDKRIALDSLHRLAGVWAARGDEFNGIFDNATTLWDVLTQIANVGDAMPIYYAGVIDVVRDEPRTVKSAMFTPSNIVANSLSVEYQFHSYDTPDHVIVEFINGETWKPDEVACVLSGGTMQNASRIKVFGCTNRNQAWRRGIRLAAANRDRRRAISLTTEMEGYIPRYGDRVAVSHDVPGWGMSGAVLAYEGGVITTDEPLDWTAGAAHYMAFRRRDGSVDGPYLAVQGDAHHAVLPSHPSLYISDGIHEEPTHYQFGPAEKRALDCQVVSMQPADQGTVTLNLVNYAESVHEAENNAAVPPPPVASLLPGIVDAPIVASVTVQGALKDGVVALVCTPARGASYYEYEAKTTGDWMPLGKSQSHSLTLAMSPGYTHIRARAIGNMPGPWALWEGDIAEAYYPPGAPTLTMADPDWSGGPLRINISNAKGNFRIIQAISGNVVKRQWSDTNFVIEWTAELASRYGTGNPLTFSVSEVNAAGSSPSPSSITVTKPLPPAPPGVTLNSNPIGVGAGTATLEASTYQDIAYYIVLKGPLYSVEVYRGAEVGTFPISWDTTYRAHIVDSWNNRSPAYEFTTLPRPDN